MLPRRPDVGKSSRMFDEETWDDANEPEAEGFVRTTCPYCGEPVEVAVDSLGGATQEYIEDCPVCCRPWQVRVAVDDDGRVRAWVDAADE